jgi:LacI family transcriptional regulator
MSVLRIARLVGVSPAAVSLGLRGSPKISDATRRKIKHAAEKLGYRPNAKLAEVMAQVRASRNPEITSCLGVISLYGQAAPTEISKHLAQIYAAAARRALENGYRLEPFWLKGPNMTPRRLRGVLDSRGIQGLLCFGSPLLNDRFPEELDHYAVVTLGLSIGTHLHRVTSHFYNDTTEILNQVHALGYRRPGLVIGRYEEVRTAYAIGAYLGWHEHVMPTKIPIPVLRLDWAEPAPFFTWHHRHQPDVIVVVLVSDEVPALEEVLKRSEIAVPRDLGVAVMTHLLDGTKFSGLHQNQELMGSWAVDLLVSRIMNRDFGIPQHPHIEMVEGRWVKGRTLRRKAQ